MKYLSNAILHLRLSVAFQRCVLAALIGLLLAGPVQAWQETLTPVATPPARVIELPDGADPQRWALEKGLIQQGANRWQLTADTQGKQYLLTRMDDTDWQAFSQRCGEACQIDSCQQTRTFSLASLFEPDPDLQLAPLHNGWLVPRAPSLQQALNGQPDVCPDGLKPQPWQGQWPAGSDLACWTLQLGSPCQQSQTPAEYLREQWRSDQLLLTVPLNAASGSELASSMGLMLLEEVTLNSIGERLIRLQRPASAPPLGNLLQQLQRDSAISLVQRDLAYFTLANKADPLRLFNYGPQLSGARQLVPRWSGKGVTVAVIDTGVDSGHPELEGKVNRQQDFTGQGYSGDAHGTAVAAIIAAASGNGVGASGVAPDATLYSLKACHPRVAGGLEARCWSSSLVKALDKAIEQNSAVINMSLGGPPSPLLHRLVKAAEQKGLIVVSAAGNGGINARPVYPAAWPEALAVTAIDRNRQLYRMANRGRYIQLAAPGVDIVTAGPGKGQPILSGTSMAAAHISGIAAQLRQLDPAADGAQISALMVLSGEDLGKPGPDTLFGNGLVNACRSAQGLKDLPPDCAQGGQ
ncbi:MAG: S8 family serine peptidase [Marinobacterium sp.]|nr:S8 family serine peptidase [Marinobacterium sp.]